MATENSRPDRPKLALRIKPASLLLWLLLFVSILLNAIVLNQLILLRRAAHTALTETRDILADLQDDTITLMVPIDQTIVIETEFPVNETLSVPIQTEVPISAAVAVNVDAGLLGGIPISFPISANVPVDITVDVPINQTIAVRAPVTLQLEIPVEIALADTPLDEGLSQFQDTLSNLAAELE